MSKITLNNVGSLIDATTAANTINANSSVVQTAFDNTLSRDGTSPNQMENILDMNSNQILNLPQPATGSSPLRLQDLTDFVGGGTVTNIPTGGTTGQVLDKKSNVDFDVGWTNSATSVGLSLPTDFTVTNSPVTTTGTLTGNWATTPSGTGAMVRATSPTLVTPALGTPTAITLTNGTGLPVTGVSGLGTGVSTFLATPNSANLISAVTDETGSGSLVFATSPTLITPVLGTPTSGVATNLTGTAAGLTAGHVTTNANLTGDVTSIGNATTLATGNAGNLNSGTLLAARMPALTGNVTSTVGTVATTIAPNAVTNAMHATQVDSTIKSNISGSTTTPSDNTITAVLDKQLGTTQGSIAYRNATNWTALSPGLSGTVLTSGGASANPTFTSVSGTGTVTSIVAGGGLSGGTITTSGTIAIIPGQVPGTATNDNATTGNVGEYIQAVVLTGSQVSLTTATATNITSVSLTAGDWDVSGTVYFNPAGTTVTSNVFSSVSSTTAALGGLVPGTGGSVSFINPNSATASTAFLQTGTARYSLASTTSIFLVAQASFTGGTNAAYGIIRARRVR